MASPLAALVGPTAVGKSELAMALASRLPVEVLVADSRQVYRGMDIGTAKPSEADRLAVPHHLLDLVDPAEPFTAADWVARAQPLVTEITARGRLPLVVSGTGLYLRALVDGYDFGGHGSSIETRVRLHDELASNGLPAMVARLEKADPAAAQRTDLRNPRRVLRALERTQLAGGPVTPMAEPYAGRVAIIGLTRPREVLLQRITARTERMFDAGLVEEVAALGGVGARRGGPLDSHGYREAARVLAGEWDRGAAVAATVRRTRQYAKRQMTWLRADRRIVWIDAGTRPADERDLVDRAEELLRRLLS